MGWGLLSAQSSQFLLTGLGLFPPPEGLVLAPLLLFPVFLFPRPPGSGHEILGERLVVLGPRRALLPQSKPAQDP